MICDDDDDDDEILASWALFYVGPLLPPQKKFSYTTIDHTPTQVRSIKQRNGDIQE